MIAIQIIVSPLNTDGRQVDHRGQCCQHLHISEHHQDGDYNHDDCDHHNHDNCDNHNHDNCDNYHPNNCDNNDNIDGNNDYDDIDCDNNDSDNDNDDDDGNDWGHTLSVCRLHLPSSVGSVGLARPGFQNKVKIVSRI